MAYWVKPFGTTDPPTKIEDDWINARNVDLDNWDIISGPAHKSPPKMGTADKVVFHGVGHSRIFGAGELLAPPIWRAHDMWGTRFPWVYPARIDVWIPLVTNGPRAAGVEPPKVLGRLQQGAPYAELTSEEYEALIGALLQISSVGTRQGFIQP